MIENGNFQFFIPQWNFLELHVFKIIFLPFNIKNNLFWAKWAIFCMVWNFFWQKLNEIQNRAILAFFVDSLKIQLKWGIAPCFSTFQTIFGSNYLVFDQSLSNTIEIHYTELFWKVGYPPPSLKKRNWVSTHLKLQNCLHFRSFSTKIRPDYQEMHEKFHRDHLL